MLNFLEKNKSNQIYDFLETFSDGNKVKLVFKLILKIKSMHKDMDSSDDCSREV